MQRRRLILGFLILIFAASTARAQFKDDAAADGAGASAKSIEKGVKLGPALTQRLKVGVICKAVGGTCADLYMTVPVPIDWPEQQVTIVNEDISSSASVTYRTTNGTVKQMVVTIPKIGSGQEAHAILTLEIVRHQLIAPDETKIYSIPKKTDRTFAPYLGVSTGIESTHPKIKALAKQVTADKETDWEKVEALYDWIVDNIEYKAGDLKGAAKALHDKNGDCEEFSSLFIAMCRSLKIPARTIWVREHCYSEFYLVDEEGKGYWFPAQSSGARAFGGIPEDRPILQKGDCFRDPDRPRDKMRYLSEFAKGAAINGGGRPNITWVNEPTGLGK